MLTGRWTKGIRLETDSEWIEEKVVILIALIAMLFSGSEHRTVEGPDAEYQKAVTSPILDTPGKEIRYRSLNSWCPRTDTQIHLAANHKVDLYIKNRLSTRLFLSR